METNALPRFDTSDNPTNCCPRFKPEGWDDESLHFENKPFVGARTRSLFHIPLNMASVFPKTFKATEEAEALHLEHFIVMSYDPSPWRGEHFFAVTKDVPGQQMERLTGDFLTKVFEGPYKNARPWLRDMETFARSKGKQPLRTYFFYTTCPKCAKAYGKNYVVAVTQVG